MGGIFFTIDNKAIETGFVTRKRKVPGSNFIQTLVFGWLDNPDATLEELAQTGVKVGLDISPQGLDKRFTKESSEYLMSFQAFGKVVDAVVPRIPVVVSSFTFDWILVVVHCLDSYNQDESMIVVMNLVRNYHQVRCG